MKRKGTIITLVTIVVLFVIGIWYIYSKDKQAPVAYKTESPTTETIVKRTVATGSIVPREEILIKPNISGIIDQILVEAGESVNEGDLIAKIKVVPNASSLTSAQNSISSSKTAVETAKLALNNQRSLYDRQKALYDKGVLAANDFDNESGCGNRFSA